MATNTQQVAAALRKDIDKALALFKSDRRGDVADRMVGNNVISNTQSFIKLQSFTDMSLPGPVGERQTGTEMAFRSVHTKTFSAQKYLGTFLVSREVWDDNQYRSTIVQNYATRMRSRCNDRREIVVQNEFFNNADTNLGPDGVAYASASHPLDVEAQYSGLVPTGLASNIVDPPETVSIALLNRVFSIMSTQVDNKGVRMIAVPPFNIEAHPLRVTFWHQIKRSVSEEPGTPDRGGNPWHSMVGDILMLPYAEYEDRTAFVAGDHRRFVWDRMNPEVTDLVYEKDDTFWSNVVFRLSVGLFDWRDAVYSLAA